MTCLRAGSRLWRSTVARCAGMPEKKLPFARANVCVAKAVRP